VHLKGTILAHNLIIECKTIPLKVMVVHILYTLQEEHDENEKKKKKDFSNLGIP
jgi:hypothetical protein